MPPGGVQHEEKPRRGRSAPRRCNLTHSRRRSRPPTRRPAARSAVTVARPRPAAPRSRRSPATPAAAGRNASRISGDGTPDHVDQGGVAAAEVGRTAGRSARNQQQACVHRDRPVDAWTVRTRSTVERMDDKAKVNGGIGSGPDFANAIHGRSLAIAVNVGISRVAAVGSDGGRRSVAAPAARAAVSKPTWRFLASRIARSRSLLTLRASSATCGRASRT